MLTSRIKRAHQRGTALEASDDLLVHLANGRCSSLSFNGTEFKRFEATSDLRDEPVPLVWQVFVSQFGNVILYKPEKPKHKCLILVDNPTKKDTDYWIVCIKTARSRYFKPTLGELVLRIWKGPPTTAGMIVGHENDNPDDNRLENLKWKFRRENNDQAHEHRRQGTRPQLKRVRVPIPRQIDLAMRELCGHKRESYYRFIASALEEFIDSRTT